MRRRDFISLLGSAAVLTPLTARAQQSSIPVIGYLGLRSPVLDATFIAAFHRGLNEGGYVDGKNLRIEYRSAQNDYGALAALATDLAGREVSVIVATSTPAALSAKAATASIPIVFETGSDPVLIGLVDSLDHPGGNVTGVAQQNITITAKRLELLHEVVPNARAMALLVNPADPTIAAAQSSGVSAAAQSRGLELHVLTASAEREFDAIFARIVKLKAGLIVGGGAFLLGQQKQLGELALRHAVPAIGESRNFVIGGGLLAYGASMAEAYRLIGVYVVHILNGDKPSNLPVQQATEVDLFVNLKSAKALGIDIPNTVLGRANEVIE